MSDGLLRQFGDRLGFTFEDLCASQCMAFYQRFEHFSESREAQRIVLTATRAVSERYSDPVRVIEPVPEWPSNADLKRFVRQECRRMLRRWMRSHHGGPAT